MKYFTHSTTSCQESELAQVNLKFGYEGIGLYYAIIERLAFAEKPINTEVLKSQLRVGKKLEKIWKFLESLEIIYSKNGETFSKLCENFVENYSKNKENTKKRVSQYRNNQSVSKNVTGYKHESNAVYIDSNINSINTINKIERENIENSPPNIDLNSKNLAPPDQNFAAIISSPKTYYRMMTEDENFIKKRANFLAKSKEQILAAAEIFYKKNDGVKNWENYADFIQHFSNWAEIHFKNESKNLKDVPKSGLLNVNPFAGKDFSMDALKRNKIEKIT